MSDNPVQEGDFGGAFDSFIDDRDEGGSSENNSGGSDTDSSGSSSGSDDTPEPTQNQDQLLDGSAGGSSGSSGGSDPLEDDGTLPDAPSTGDNPFDDSDSSGSSGGSSGGSSADSSGDDSGNRDSGGSNRQSGSGIGPGGVSGSEAATPDAETDAPTNDSTQNIEATRTARLESDSTANDVVRNRAQKLEDRVAGEKVTDVVDGLNTTGAELREEDVEVVRDGDQLVASLSPVGEERIENIADRQTEESAERQVESALNTSFTDADVSVNEDGSVDVSQNVENEAVEQGIAENNPGVSEGDVSFKNGEPQVDQTESQTDPVSRVESETGLDEGEDFTLTREDGNVSVNVTETGAQELRGRNEQAEGDALTEIVTGVEGVTGADLPGNTSVAGEARVEQANSETGELFGGRGDIEQGLRDAGNAFSEGAQQIADPAGDALAANPLVDILDPSPDGIDRQGFENATTPQSREERNRASLFSGTAAGAAEALNAPRLGVAGIELGEAASAGIDATAVSGGDQEEFEEFEQRAAGGAAVQAVDTTRAARDSPFNTAGTVVGGAVGATGLLRAGRAVGGSTGARTAGSLVQPGEELFKALRRSDSGTSAPSGTGQLGSGGTGSLLDADALDAGRGPSTSSRVRGELSRSDTLNRIRDSINEFRSDTSAQLEFAQQRDRGGGSSGSSSPPDAPQDFDPSRSEVLGGSPRDQLSRDITGRARTQRQQNRGTFDGVQQSEPGRTRAEPEGARQRRQQAQRQEATQEPRAPDRSETARRVGEQVGARAGAAVGVGGLLDLQDQAQAASVGVGAGQESGIGTFEIGFEDVGIRGEGRLGNRTELGQEPGTETGQEPGLNLRQESRTEVGQESLIEVGQEPGRIEQDIEPETEPPRVFEPIRPRGEDDDDALQSRQQDVFGIGAGGDSEPSDGFATGFIEETLTGFGEGGLNVEAAQAVDEGGPFRQTEAQASQSSGFEEATDLFTFGGDGR